MTGKRIGYIRVSTKDQNPERQLVGIELDETFTDYWTGSCRDRPKLKEMLRYARKGDVVYVHDLDRLARNLKELKEIVCELIANEVAVMFVSENLKFDSDSSHLAELQLNMLGAFAQFERSNSLKRIREGIERAKARGAYKGRQPVINEKQFELIKTKLEWGLDKKTIAQQLGIGVSTVYKYLKHGVPRFKE